MLCFINFILNLQLLRSNNQFITLIICNLCMIPYVMFVFLSLISYCSYVCHAEINAILNTNHASAAGQVMLLFYVLSVILILTFSCMSTCVVICATMVMKIRERKTKKSHRFYVVRQCAYIHWNDGSNFHYDLIGLLTRVFTIIMDMTK